MRTGYKLNTALLCAVSAIALSSAAVAQTSDTETVVVTGSRVISDAANSPTPLTVVSTAQLLATTPSDIPAALNKLPVFQGSSTPRGFDGVVQSSNTSGNVLNLRNFGGQRTLIMLDGQRVAPSNANGTVDIDTLPQMLMSRVDIVTGGASAVYGSDAVTGVVNFILDKHFTGVKIEANAGISNYADAASYKAGLAAGEDLFGGRAHIEGSVQHFHQDGVAMDARFQGRQNWLLTGTGTAANPFVSTQNALRSAYAYGGYIACTGTTANPCAANGKQFMDGGVIAPWYPGATTGTNGINSGGDGVTTNISHITATLTTDESFARFSYNVDDTTTFYLELTATQSIDKGTWQNAYLKSGNAANMFFKTNAYLTSDAKAQLAGGTTSNFTLTEWFIDQGPNGGFQTKANDRNLDLNTGIDGTWMGKYDWHLYYTHGESRMKEQDEGNINNQDMYAAEDAVVNSSGQVVCQVSTTQYANLYPGCVPMNPFGPNALTSGAYQYWTKNTDYLTNFALDDVSASISGEVFDDWAGPVKAALSGETRWLSYGVVSDQSPSVAIDCTGLRLCNTATALWQGNIVAPLPTVSENVWEFAGEVNVPLLKDAPLVQNLSADIAGRYTDYSTSGAVETWKIGLDWHLNDDIRFRATNSVDIRAPTLNDLFSPVQQTHASFTDIHTATNGALLTSSQGNPNLVPEVARTYTAGIVLTPTFIPGLTASADYYTIVLKNAIGSISGSSTAIQNLCNASGGASPYCALFIRPLPFANTTPANYPTVVLSESLNTAYNKIEGLDLELNYGFQMADVLESAPGAVNFRLLTTMQPVNESLTYPGSPLGFASNPKTTITTFAGYAVGSWTISLQNRWLGGYSKLTQFGLVYLVPHVPSRNYDDITIDRKFSIGDQTVDGYLSIQNVANTQPPVAPTGSSSPGLYYMGSTASTYDAVGRYFTIGVRALL